MDRQVGLKETDHVFRLLAGAVGGSVKKSFGHLFSLGVEFFPALVHSKAIRVRLMRHRQPALIPRFGKLVIETSERNIFAIVLIKCGIVFTLRDEDNAVGATIIHRCQAHGAGMSQNVELATSEMLCLQLGRRRSDRADLGMGRRVVGLRDQIDAFGQSFVLVRSSVE